MKYYFWAYAILWSGVLELSVVVESGAESGVRLWSDIGVKNWSEILEWIHIFKSDSKIQLQNFAPKSDSSF
jgi:hypothetical protein